MPGPLQVAVIGCGWAGTRHARAFTACGAQVRWAVDLNLARAQALSASLGSMARTTDEYRVALADPQVEAVTICLPHDLHASVAVATAQAGKHILCEKPLAATLEGADAMIAAAEQHSVVLMVAENVRFSPLYQQICQMVQRGAIGRAALLQMTRQCYLTQSFLTERRWFLDARAAAGGIMMSGGVHTFEAARMILGEIESIYALRAPQRFQEMQGEDTSAALIRFANGAIGTIVESFVMKSLATATGAEVHTIRIDGELGSLSCDDGHTLRLYSEREDFLPAGTSLSSTSQPLEYCIHIPPQDTFLLEVEHFLRCLQTGEEPITSGRSQRTPLAVVLAAYRSMESGLPIRLSP